MIPALLFVSVTLVLVVGVGLGARRAAQARVTALQQFAERSGWFFREEVPFGTIPDLDRFELFKVGGRSRKLRHLLTSPPGDVRAVLFEFSYVVSTGKSSHRVQQSVFYATSEHLALPTFSLRPENFFHGIATALGYQDIDLETHPTFSEMFLLRGSDETAVREAFTDGVCEFFEGRRGVCAAGVGHELLYWRANRLAKPEELETMIADGYELAQRFIEAE